MTITEQNFALFADATKELVNFYYFLHKNSETETEIAIVNDLGDFLEYIQTFFDVETKKINLGTEIPDKKCTIGILATIFLAQKFAEIGELGISKKLNDFCLLFENNKVIKVINQTQTCTN